MAADKLWLEHPLDGSKYSARAGEAEVFVVFHADYSSVPLRAFSAGQRAIEWCLEDARRRFNRTCTRGELMSLGYDVTPTLLDVDRPAIMTHSWPVPW